MIDLHYWPTPNGKKVTILLEECGAPYLGDILQYAIPVVTGGMTAYYRDLPGLGYLGA